jgi:glucose/arabinose dehydrogenase
MFRMAKPFSGMMTMVYHKFPLLVTPLLVGCSLLACARVARSQDSQDQPQSVADAARRAREEKKNASKPSTKPGKVITDDDLSKTASSAQGVNVGGPPKLETQPPSDSAVVATEAADQAAESGNPKKGDSPEIVKIKEDLAKAEKDLDLAQRELALDQDSFYSNPDYSHDRAGQTKLADEQQDINNKKQRIEELKTQLAALQEAEARKKAASAQKSSAAPAQPQ